jgi:hypothetical protein
MGKILQPFGEAVASIEMKFDATGKVSIHGRKKLLHPKSGIVVGEQPMAPLEVCLYLSNVMVGTIGAMLSAPPAPLISGGGLNGETQKDNQDD